MSTQPLPMETQPKWADWAAPIDRCLGCPAFNRVLVIQDEGRSEPALDEGLHQSRFQVERTSGREKALEHVNELDYEFVVWDLQRPQREQMAALRQFRRQRPKLPVIVLADGAAADTAIELMKAGAYDFIAKPFEPVQFVRAAERALKARRLMCEAVLIPSAIEIAGTATRLVGRSAAMQEVYKQIGLVAEREEPVLIFGETGTGKELVARAIYQHSRRRDHPFLAINCAALPESLLESELFGHEKGAFTGATHRRLGAFEQAHQGTLFLDEIADMPLLLQSKILRALQQGEIQRLGGNETVSIDVRLIAATNKVLEKAIQENHFREDLYYRLKVVSIRIPPLREHPEDVLELAEYFVGKYTPAGEPRPALEALALRKLQSYYWPGNVRELENTIRRALVVATGQAVMEKDIVLGESGPMPTTLPAPVVPAACGFATPPIAPCAHHPGGDIDFQLDQLLQHWLARHTAAGPDTGHSDLAERLEDKVMQAALRHTHGNQLQAARLLGISRSTLRSRLKKQAAE